MKQYFSEQAILAMREAIRDAGGNEVFFLGRTDENRIVVETEPLARGNRDAVAAIMIATSFGDVVIHNHPSGTLTPSQADIEIASLLGNQGVGFYIVDNAVEQCYQAVAPFTRKEVERLSFPEIERMFARGGVFAENLPGYEFRDEQLRMAFAVTEAFNDNRVAVIEAGTGTGKSLAYLVPAALWAIRNKERVVVSTNTINLQEQLTRKDIPFLREHGGLNFRAVLVKGRGNYLCLRKLEGVKSEPSLFAGDPAAGELAAIVAWSARTSEGCKSDLSFIPKEESWDEVACEADQCGRVKCPFYTRCFFYTARRQAASADLLVVNHSLLMADVALRRETGYGSTAILPPFERLIFDEGHHLEDVATGHLSSQISRQGLQKLLGKLQNPRKPQRGLLPQLSAQLAREVPEVFDDLYRELAELLEGKLLPRRQTLVDAATRALDAVGLALLTHLKGEPGGERKLRVTPALHNSKLWREVEDEARELAAEINGYVKEVKEFLKGCGRLPERTQEKLAGNLIDLKGIAGRLEASAADLLAFISRDDEVCRWFEVKKGAKGITVRLCSSPLEVAQSLKATVIDAFRTVVVTSATLAVGESFDFLKRRTGIGLVNRERVTELLLASPFDYEHQAFVGIPSDLPEPVARGFGEALEVVLHRGLAISEGHAFVLFTSYDLLTRLYGRMAETMKRRGLTPLRQGEVNRHHLLSRFRREKNAVLFGTDSFWEGVDVQGKALELVAITRLPFRVPTEPILEARAEHIAERGGDPFMEYTVPQAVIKFKQGFGRLIRSREDRGAVLILDSRVLTKNYGRFFLRSLPPVKLVSGPSDEVFDEMERFFTPSLSSAASPRG
ncbi:helicase C-terminal domain-containing protein [Geobacter sp.]|uniref:helicase C-terminal domain-containing protein n=1 Tax=Geobacter sp. TaxID=46610 RepID=UPI002618DA90|nr:helicase C-terminal domain-containing protein [Geobacter sp.]